MSEPRVRRRQPTDEPAPRGRGRRTPAREASPAAAARLSRTAGDRFFRDLVGSMRNGVVAITRDGRIAAMNGVAYRTLGLSPRESDVGRPFKEVLGAVPDVTEVLMAAFEMSYLPSRAEMRLEASGRMIGYTLSVVRDRRGHATGTVLVFKDLTRVGQIEERERLRDRLAALGEMAAAIAHEVKNPLAGIEVMAGVLRRQLSDRPDAQAILNDIINESKMANAIVLEVLDFVRPIRLQVESVVVRTVLEDAVVMADRLVSRGSITVSLEVPDTLPAIHADGNQLRQVFVNLLTNAYEALGTTGQVVIRASRAAAEEEAGPGEPPRNAENLVVEVDDDGSGVPADLTERIFSPFFTSRPRGCGLGLAIVRKIVDAHDGRIEVTTRAQGGARFRVTLPVSGTRESVLYLQ